MLEQSEETQLRERLVSQLEGGQAYLPIEELLDHIDFEDLGVRPAGLPYSFYEQFFHLRVAQYDIYDFSVNPDYTPQAWPEDYWPLDHAPETEEEWEELKQAFFKERNQFIQLILDERNDLYEPFPHGDGQNLLREAVLLLEHNSYHIGQLAIITRLLEQEEQIPEAD
ncbi:MAG: DinB family protein [Balneolaceae bacterium]|nr:DinB family protein [Balneolaceae bacterium]